MQFRLKIVPNDRSTPRRHRSPVVLILVLLLWSGILGWGWSQAASSRPMAESFAQVPTQTAPVETTDLVPERYQLGQQLYLENCATCHVGLPPAVMPTRTWAEILPDSSHYGVQITPLNDLSLQVVWQYISTYSRPLNPGEAVPYRLRQSRYFKALHPKVELSQPITVSSCAACHPAAAQFNYRSLAPEWENAP